MYGRRAVSPLFASIILIVVAFFGGFIIHHAFTAFIHSSQPSSMLLVEDASITKGTTGLAVFTCTVKNIGGGSITRITVQLGDESEADYPNVSPSNPLNPGQSASIVLSLDGWKYAVGKTYMVKLIAYLSDGSIFAHATTAFCKGVNPSPTWAPPQNGGDGWSGGGGLGSQSASITLIDDDFSGGSLSGWSLWGDGQGYNIEVDRHGRPAPCLHVYGNGCRGAHVGAAKTVSIPEMLLPDNVNLRFDFNVHALKDDEAFPGNLWLRIEADGQVAFEGQIYDAESAGSGWRSSQAVVNFTESSNTITLIFYMIDESGKIQEFWIDNVVLTVEES